MPWTQTDRSFKQLINKRVTSSGKQFYEEIGDNTINIHNDEIWNQTLSVDPLAAVLAGVAQQYTLFTMTEDVTVGSQQCYYAFSGGNRLKDWIGDKYGSDYAIKLYQSTGAQIFPTDPCAWFFDYPTGILTFNGSTAGLSKPFKVTGYRYIGTKGGGISQGATGVAGATGISGVAGQTGIQGQTGVQGVQGQTGVQGIQGQTGVQGFTGLPGDDGLPGVQGQTGVQGATGVGVQGQTGVQGLQGDTGVQGTTGLQGLPGETGVQGISGDTGVQGPQGQTGIQGIQGDTGALGIQGTTGVQGIQGQTGQIGIPGVTGLQGDEGPQGIQGATGFQGQTGIQGLQGDTGSSGQTGVQGPPGVQGIQGTTGAQGYNGLQGDTGAQGLQGQTGVQGIQGSTGPLNMAPEALFNPTSRYQVDSSTGEEVWIVSSSTLYRNISWDRTGTTLNMYRPAHGHISGNRVVVRNTNTDYQVATIDSTTLDSFAFTTQNIDGTAGLNGAYSLGFTFTHTGGSPKTGGSVFAPSGDHSDCQLHTLHIRTGTRQGTTYTLTVPASAVNGAGMNTSLGTVFIPDYNVRADSDNLAAVGATINTNISGSYSTFQFGSLGIGSLSRFIILHF